MSAITFTSITIIDQAQKIAKKVGFKPGLNVITTPQKDGNDRGKSVIVRSLYHAMGAEGLFDTQFHAPGKSFLLEFTCGDDRWLLMRLGSSYKLFDSEEQLVWKCHRIDELAERLFETFQFKVMLPSRDNKQLELAPPVYSYLPSYIDQQGSKGSEFCSFNNLGQYANVKADLFYSYAGAVDENYYEVTMRSKDLAIRGQRIDAQLALNNEIIARVDEQLGDSIYADSEESLDKDLSFREAEYNRIAAALATTRKKIMRLRDERIDRERAIHGADAFGRHWETGYRKLRLFKQCPLCKSHLEDDLSVRVSECETREDVLYVKGELERDLDSIEKRIAALEKEYKQLLSELDALRAALREGQDVRSRALASEGLVDMRAKLVAERHDLAVSKLETEDEIESAKADLKVYQERKKKSSDRFVELLKEGAVRLGLRGIDLTKLKDVRSAFKSNGSNEALATLVWYLSINQVQREMNPGRIQFPMVIDSPMSGEQDDDKKQSGYEYIISSLSGMHQVIITGLAVEAYAQLPDNVNRIVLTNEKYHVLNADDYEDCKALFGRLLEAGGKTVQL